MNDVQKQLQLSDVSVADYLTKYYALWLDFRTIDENALHGSGRRIENASEGIILKLEKVVEGVDEAFDCYIFLIMSTQLNIKKQ